MKHHISITEDSLTIHGVSYGTSIPEFWYSLPSAIWLINTDKEITDYKNTIGHNPIVVVKIPGGQHWRDKISGQVYHGATFMILELLRVIPYPVEVGHYFECQQLIEFPIRKGK